MEAQTPTLRRSLAEEAMADLQFRVIKTVQKKWGYPSAQRTEMLKVLG